MVEDLVPNEITVTQPPSAQMAVDIIPNWSSALPKSLGVTTTGNAALFEDGRVTWAIERLGGVKGKTVLELGPLEGGHSYMLEQAGAASIVAIEANKRCYLKCLIVKELLGMTRTHFLLGDFMPWLEAHPERFDVIWCAGVLYHMAEPLKLLELCSQRTDKMHIWTHYAPEKYDPKSPWAVPIVRTEMRKFRGRDIPHCIRSYMHAPTTTNFCGGVYNTCSWLRRDDILAVLKDLGYSRIDITLENTEHVHGPSFCLAVSR